MRGINTCLDTSGFRLPPANANEADATGILPDDIERLLSVTDTVLLDIKHIDPVRHKALTGQDNAGIIALARRLSELGIRTWIRHVLVPGYTDDEASLRALNAFLRTLKNIERIEILPYHGLGAMKYKDLGIDYVLKDLESPTLERVANAKKILECDKYTRWEV